MTLPLAITAGEPAGIGPELLVKLAHRQLPRAVVAIGDRQLIQARAALIGLDIELVPPSPRQSVHQPGRLPVLDVPLVNRDCLGKPDAGNAGALLNMLNVAIDGCRDRQFAAMVTGPLQKSTILDGGFAFSGHTEYVAQRTDSPLPVMLLANESLRVALVTTHLPLRNVADAITSARVGAVLDVVWQDLHRLYNIQQPNIAVCGLNPHAGEGGHLGHEDAAEIQPAINAQRQLGRQVHGPYPADSIFAHQGRDADAIVAMYHDQGLPVIKDRGFGSIVNITLGLNIIRTSVDHGSALDIAGTGKADVSSLMQAVQLADRFAQHRPKSI
ncbi:MAG: 4-hydroxythreonine-4-phosphate dehydrogenase PdxA [Pseudomonadota bacterium]